MPASDECSKAIMLCVALSPGDKPLPDDTRDVGREDHSMLCRTPWENKVIGGMFWSPHQHALAVAPGVCRPNHSYTKDSLLLGCELRSLMCDL